MMGYYSKMVTSESDQSLSDKSMTRSMDNISDKSMTVSTDNMSEKSMTRSVDSEKSMTRSSDNTNRATYYFQHVSDEEAIKDNDNHFTDLSDNNIDLYENGNSIPIPGAWTNSIENFENNETIDCKIKRHSLMYSRDDINKLVNKAEKMVLNTSLNSNSKGITSCEASGEEESEEDARTRPTNFSSFNSPNNFFTSSPKKEYYDPIKRQFSVRKISSMEMSSPDSPDSRKSILDAISASEESRTLEADQFREEGENTDENSLDEISSGEMSSRDSEDRGSLQSTVGSDLWDQENYLSEYNYDEPLEEDKARKLLNFGDDYRNFIGSMSESQSSINDALTLNNRRCRKRSRKKQVIDDFSNESQSDNELEDVCNVISDSHKKLNNVENLATDFYVDGFIKKENQKEYNGLVTTCTEYLKHLIHLLQSIELDDSFMSKKKSREIKFLLARWETLLQKINENIELTKIYDKLKDDIATFKQDLLQLMKTSNSQKGTPDYNSDLADRLQKYQEAMSQLSVFKSRLFQLNLSVHNFLASLSSFRLVDQNQVNLAIHLKEEVVDMYKLWDKSHHQTAQDIANTQEALRKFNIFEQELMELRGLLQKDAQHIKESDKKKGRKKQGKNSSCDSGISDSSGSLSDYDISQREQHLTKLRIMSKDLEQDFLSDSSALSIISQTLETTSKQLKDLQSTYQKYKKKERNKRKVKSVKSPERDPKKEASVSSSRGSRVVKMAVILSMGLMLTLFLSWMTQPRCCDYLNNMNFARFQFRYINGPPPI